MLSFVHVCPPLLAQIFSCWLQREAGAGASGVEVLTVTALSALGFLVAASLLLVLLYFFLNQVRGRGIFRMLFSPGCAQQGDMRVVCSGCRVAIAAVALVPSS